MPENTLKSIIEVEAEIRARLDDERRRVRSWLEQVRSDTDTWLQAEMQRLEAADVDAVREAQRLASTGAEALVQEARRLAGQLSSIPDATLHGVVVRHLRAIVPRGEDARQDGQD